MALPVECDNLYPQNKFRKCGSGYCVLWRIKSYCMSYQDIMLVLYQNLHMLGIQYLCC